MTPHVTPKCSNCLAPDFISKVVLLSQLPPHETFASVILIHLPDPKYIFLTTYAHTIAYTWNSISETPSTQVHPKSKSHPPLRVQLKLYLLIKPILIIFKIFHLRILSTPLITVHDVHGTPITSFISTCYHRPMRLVGAQQIPAQ